MDDDTVLQQVTTGFHSYTDKLVAQDKAIKYNFASYLHRSNIYYIVIIPKGSSCYLGYCHNIMSDQIKYFKNYVYSNRST